MKLSDYVMKRVAEHVDTVFFIPGGGCMHLVESLGNSELKAVSMLHEQGAAFAASGYSIIHSMGVCLTTSGPGATNAITGVAAAWMDSYPILVISGQVNTKTMMTGLGLRSFGSQEVDTIGMVRVITKYAVTVMDPTAIEGVMDIALITAMTGRHGPVWVDIPLDVQAREVC